MADPKDLRRYPDGVRLGPVAVDAVPADWASVDYVITIEAHPDLPAVPILKFVSATLDGGTSSSTDDPYTAALRMDGDARVREAGLSTTTTSTTSTYDPTTALQADGDARIREASLSGTSLTDDYIALLAQFYGA